MASLALDEHLAAERTLAVKYLLASPLLDAEASRDEFRLAVRHVEWLIGYFEQTCGWSLVVDPAAGFARLSKRPTTLDAPRPLRRIRGEAAPFDRRRYELLCHVCAELVRHPITTVGFLATAITAEARLDTSRYGERSALVDALRVLASWGALRVTAGEVDAYADSPEANAILTADTARLHRLIVSANAPASLPEGTTIEVAIDVLAAEPRYGVAGEVSAPEGTDDPDAGDLGGSGASDEARNRWARHRLGRRLLDDPVLYLDDLSTAEHAYLNSISGRKWLRDRVSAAGFDLEERTEGLLPVDPDGIATDLRFPAPQGNAFQLALLLADRLVPVGVDGNRRLARLDPAQLQGEVRTVLTRYPAWARGRREGDGPERLLAEAIDLLVACGLARRETDGSVLALPALARYGIADPVVSETPTLFEEI